MLLASRENLNHGRVRLTIGVKGRPGLEGHRIRRYRMASGTGDERASRLLVGEALGIGHHADFQQDEVLEGLAEGVGSRNQFHIQSAA
jgi:hypothetical protein